MRFIKNEVFYKNPLTIIIYKCNIGQVADSNNAERGKRNKKLS